MILSKMHEIHVYTILSFHIPQSKLSSWHGFLPKILWIISQSLVKKIIHFLKGEVCGTEKAKDNSKALGYSTVRQNGTAFIDLYKQQKSVIMKVKLHVRLWSLLRSRERQISLLEMSLWQSYFMVLTLHSASVYQHRPHVCFYEYKARSVTFYSRLRQSRFAVLTACD